MSEKIKITLVTENEINGKDIEHNTGNNIMSTLLKAGLVSDGFCGGRGVCKRCRIRFMDSAPVPTGIERNTFSPEELRQGWRLACVAKPRHDCAICLDFVKSMKIEILTDANAVGDKELNNVDSNCNAAGNIESKNIDLNVSATNNIEYNYIDLTSQQERIIDTDPTSQQECIIAADLGTTTIAMQLVKIEDGKVIGTYCAMNPQRSYGADVLSRIQAANAGHADIMKESVWKVIYDGVSRFANKADEAHLKICCICIAGNTTMEHLLMGLSTSGLGQSPFTPVELGLQRCTITVKAANEYELPVYITPGISAFVGGDIAAGLYYCNLLDISASKQQNTAALFIDLGTNGEMAIVSGGRIIATATAAGPAFEGGATAAAPGSDIIKAAAFLLDKGIIDETGLMKEPYFSEGIDIDAIRLTQSDIRALQVAKAAVRAGINILCSKIDNCHIAKVYLAGGFGYYLDINSAAAIGLLPQNLKDCTQAVGNTSLAGSFKMGKDLLRGVLTEDKLAERLSRIESVNLAQEQDFDKLYLSYINFLKA